MRIGVDSSVIVAAVHANHPRYATAAQWMIRSLAGNELLVCHHSILETYAVLTSLPGDLRVTPSETRDLLSATVKSNMTVAGFRPESIWSILESFPGMQAVGGHSYDAYVAHVLHDAGAEAVVTFNRRHFAGLVTGLAVIDPGEDSQA